MQQHKGVFLEIKVEYPRVTQILFFVFMMAQMLSKINHSAVIKTRKKVKP